jgi:hypothetical protein
MAADGARRGRLTEEDAMNLLRAVIGAVAVLVLAACTAGPPHSASQHAAVTGHTSARGMVTGRFVLEGGPIGPDGQQPGERPIAGTVLFRAGPGQAVKVRVGKSGTFSVWLPAGIYQVSGRSPAVMQVSNGAVIGAGGKLISGREHERPCSQQRTVTVASGQTARIAVTCIVP